MVVHRKLDEKAKKLRLEQRAEVSPVASNMSYSAGYCHEVQGCSASLHNQVHLSLFEEVTRHLSSPWAFERRKGLT